MSIRGVDAQIMISRAPEFMKDASVQQKAGDRMQDFLAVQAQAEAEHDKASVAQLQQASRSELQLDSEGRSQNGYAGGGERGGKRQDSEASLLDEDVGPADNIIDIRL